METRGSLERWEPRENKLLVKKYFEHNNDFKLIQNSFPGRSLKGIKSQFKRLTRKAEENQMSLSSYIENMNDNTYFKDISHIFINEENKYRIYKKCNKYPVEDITESMLLICKDDNLLCAKCTNDFAYLLDHWPDESLNDSFFKSAMKIQVILFLQMCIMFDVYSYSLLKKKTSIYK